MADLTQARLLLVDDQPANLRVLRDALEDGGYEISVASSGQTTLRVAAARRPDLILLQDLMFLERVLNNGKHLLELINGVLDLSKIEAGRLELVPETFEVANLVEEVTANIQPLAAKNDNTLKCCARPWRREAIPSWWRPAGRRPSRSPARCAPTLSCWT